MHIFWMIPYGMRSQKCLSKMPAHLWDSQLTLPYRSWSMLAALHCQPCSISSRYTFYFLKVSIYLSITCSSDGFTNLKYYTDRKCFATKMKVINYIYSASSKFVDSGFEKLSDELVIICGEITNSEFGRHFLTIRFVELVEDLELRIRETTR